MRYKYNYDACEKFLIFTFYIYCKIGKCGVSFPVTCHQCLTKMLSNFVHFILIDAYDLVASYIDRKDSIFFIYICTILKILYFYIFAFNYIVKNISYVKCIV